MTCKLVTPWGTVKFWGDPVKEKYVEMGEEGVHEGAADGGGEGGGVATAKGVGVDQGGQPCVLTKIPCGLLKPVAMVTGEPDPPGMTLIAPFPVSVKKTSPPDGLTKTP